MNYKLLTLFLILLFGLIACSFLGGHKCEGMENADANIYTSHGSTAIVNTNDDNVVTIDYTNIYGNKTTYTQTKTQPGPNGGNLVYFNEPNGTTAHMITTNTTSTITIVDTKENDEQALVVLTSNKDNETNTDETNTH